MKAKSFITALFIFSFFISCNKAENSNDLAKDLKEPMLQKSGNKEKQQIPVGNLQQTTTDSGITPIPLQAASNPDWDKKMIKTGILKLEVKNFKNYSTNVHKIIKQFGGYIAQEDQTLSEEKTETVISIKVPVEQFENMINQLPGDDDKVMERKITTEDVTGEVVDTRSRLESKKQMRLKYLEFLKQSKNMEEVLKVQNEINGIQEEMESAAGRIESLTHQSAYSTINLSFYQLATGYKPSDGPPSFFARLIGAFKIGGSWIADLFVGLVSIWPLLLIVFGIYFGWRRLRPSRVIVRN